MDKENNVKIEDSKKEEVIKVEDNKPTKNETPELTDNQLDNMAKTAGNEINKQDKIKIKIPIDKQNKTDSVVPVCINGYIWQIKRGESVEVPEVVADILTEAGYI